MTTKDYSGSTDFYLPKLVWDYNEPGDDCFIQNVNPNRSGLTLLVFTTPNPDGTDPRPIRIILPEFGDFIDASHLNPAAKVFVKCHTQASFTAFRNTL